MYHTDPANGATYVSTGACVRIEFNTNMNQSSVEGAFSIVPDASGSFQWYDYEEFAFCPDSSLQSLTTYSVTIDTTAQDLGGNHLPDPYTFSFQTEP